MFSSDAVKFSWNLASIATLPPSNVQTIANPSTGYTVVDLMVYQNGTGIPVYCSNDITVTIEVEHLYESFGDEYMELEYPSYVIQNGTSGTTVNLDQSSDGTIYRHFRRITQNDFWLVFSNGSNNF